MLPSIMPRREAKPASNSHSQRQRGKVCPTPQIHWWKPNPNVRVLGGGTLRRWLGHEGEALVHGIPLEETPESSLAPSLLYKDTKDSRL